MKTVEIKLHIRLPEIVVNQMKKYKSLGYSQKDVITMALIYYFQHNKVDID